MYDVFISCKSEDYPLGMEVYDFLKENHINSFIATEELRKQGKSDFGSVIDEALDAATHLIVVATNPSYLFKENSPYVYDEWHTFNEELKSGRKEGNIITILKDSIKIGSIPFPLRKYQRLMLNDYKNELLNYLGDARKAQRITELSNVTSQIELKSSERPIIEPTLKNRVIMSFITLMTLATLKLPKRPSP